MPAAHASSFARKTTRRPIVIGRLKLCFSRLIPGPGNDCLLADKDLARLIRAFEEAVANILLLEDGAAERLGRPAGGINHSAGEGARCQREGQGQFVRTQVGNLAETAKCD